MGRAGGRLNAGSGYPRRLRDLPGTVRLWYCSWYMLKVTGAEGFAVLLMFALTGCASAAVQRGALIGALSGAALGAGTGVLVSDPDLLGSAETPESGDIGLDAGESVASGAAIGLVFGALVGAMIGHGSEDEYPLPAEQSQAGERRIRVAGEPTLAAPSAF